MINTNRRLPWLRALLLHVCLTVCLLVSLAGFVPRAAAEPAGGKTVIMGTSPDYPPYESVDAKNSGEIVGLDIDIARHIAEQLGYKLEIAAMDFNGLIAALQTERVDFVMSAMSVTEDRKKSVDFSQGYYTARNTIVSRGEDGYRTIEELDGKRIGIQLGSTQETAAAGIPGAKLTKLNKISDLIQALKADRIDAAIVEDAVAAGLTAENPDLQFSMIPSSGEDEGYAIAFPKGSPLREAFDAELTKMKNDGTLDAIIAKWFPEDEPAAVNQTRRGLDFSVLEGYLPYILRGIWVTLLFTFVSALFGLVWGAVLSLFKLSRFRPLRWFATAYTSVFRGTPLLLQLFIFYYAVPQLFQYNIPALAAAGLAFGLNSAAYLSETIRAGILAVDKGQREAALALGLSPRVTMVSIIFPQAIKNILPALVNEFVALIKESSLVSVIGVQDLMRRVNVVQANEMRAFEPLIIAAAIYYVLVLILTSLAHLLERRLRRGD